MWRVVIPKAQNMRGFGIRFSQPTLQGREGCEDVPQILLERWSEGRSLGSRRLHQAWSRFPNRTRAGGRCGQLCRSSSLRWSNAGNWQTSSGSSAGGSRDHLQKCRSSVCLCRGGQPDGGCRQLQSRVGIRFALSCIGRRECESGVGRRGIRSAGGSRDRAPGVGLRNRGAVNRQSRTLHLGFSSSDRNFPECVIGTSRCKKIFQVYTASKSPRRGRIGMACVKRIRHLMM